MRKTAVKKTVIKLSLKYHPMSVGNPCLAEPNIEVLLFA